MNMRCSVRPLSLYKRYFFSPVYRETRICGVWSHFAPPSFPQSCVCWGGKPISSPRRWKPLTSRKKLSWARELALAVVVSLFLPAGFSHPSLPLALSLFSGQCSPEVDPDQPPPVSVLQPLSADHRGAATFERGTELLWSNGHKMPNKTYGQPLPRSRSPCNTMDHCYGMGWCHGCCCAQSCCPSFFFHRAKTSSLYLYVSLIASLVHCSFTQICDCWRGRWEKRKMKSYYLHWDHTSQPECGSVPLGYHHPP